MKTTILILISFFVAINTVHSQNALPLTGPDCNGYTHDLISDLDSGKAVVVFFFMNNCGSCPPPAAAIQAMSNEVMTMYPNSMSGYAMPFNNSTTCQATSNWVSNNNLTFYAPYDSGAAQVAYYGGFGMPTIVLLGYSDHRVMFSTLNWIMGDTAIMKDSVIAMLEYIPDGVSARENDQPFRISPNPANVLFSATTAENIETGSELSVFSITGELIYRDEEYQPAEFIWVNHWNSGIYFVRIETSEGVQNLKLNVVR